MSERALAQVQESSLSRLIGTLTGSLSALGEVVQEVRPRLDMVEDLIQRHLATSSPAIQEAGAYVFEAGGKRLRPAVLLAVARALGYEGNNDVRYAAAVEIVHTATLVHDDVIDHASVRRGRVTPNSRWGNQFAVLLGDWLYTRAMEIALEDDHILPLRVLSRATTSLTEGEILALGLQGRSDITLEQYQQVCELKTAELFAAAASIPACFDQAHARFREPLETYGRHLGLCFQIIDDLLDVTASEKRLGKPVFSDLREGRLTLPFILALPELSAHERETVEAVLAGREVDDGTPRRLRKALDRQGALDAARQIAHDHAEQAAAALSILPASATRQALQGAPLALLDRQF
jgi:octaprenyl-diphosphate synthase